MVDNLTKQKRSRVMSSIRGKNTRPELSIRKILWAKGFRYRIHDKSVYGIPDISNKSRKVAVFIDGCFWHGCKKCYKEPRTNTSFWRNKVKRNRQRRTEVKRKLLGGGWKVLEVWEHQVNEDARKTAKLVSSSF